MPPDAALAAVDPAYEKLDAVLVDATGHHRLAMSSHVRERVRRRVASCGLSSVDAYLELLRSGEDGQAELDSLIAELTVGETSFFRHREHFDLLRDRVLPDCLARNAASRQLRIWSAGCANGAEPYSIAILVRAILGERMADWNVTIVGSDINRAFLAEAERGVYSAWSLREVSKPQISGHFARSGRYYRIRDRYRGPVRLVHHNLLREEMPSIHKNIFAFDIIFCRNVMIYFHEATNRDLAERLAGVLVDEGWLFVGPSDLNPHLARHFALDPDGSTTVYRKVAAAAAPVRAEPTALAPRASEPARPAARRAASRPVRRPAAPRDAAPAGDLAAIVELANRAAWDEAARACRALLDADPCNAGAHYYYALVLQYSGAAGAAEQALKRAIYLDRDFALAHHQLALTRKAAHDVAGCARALRNTLEALGGAADDQVVSPCGQVTAADLRELASEQLALMGRP